MLHRFIYEKFKGSIPKGKIIRHKCDIRNCINPEHLELGTYYDNIQDMVKRNRQAKGERIGVSKLTERQVREIKKELGNGSKPAQIYKKYGVTYRNIYDIKNGKIWKHVTI